MTHSGNALAGLLLALTAGSAIADEAPGLVQFTAAARGDVGWRPHQEKDGIVLERRAVPGSRYFEHRAVAGLALDPDRAAAEIWRCLRDGDMDSLKLRRLLRQDENELLIYDQIRTPIVSDRDYTLRVQRLAEPARHHYRFQCRTANELGPPPAEGHVRIPVIRAGWEVEPDGRGGSRLTYYAYSEPGGLLTAVLSRGAQASRSLADMVRMVKRMNALAGAGGR